MIKAISKTSKCLWNKEHYSLLHAEKRDDLTMARRGRAIITVGSQSSICSWVRYPNLSALKSDLDAFCFYESNSRRKMSCFASNPYHTDQKKMVAVEKHPNILTYLTIPRKELQRLADSHVLLRSSLVPSHSHNWNVERLTKVRNLPVLCKHYIAAKKIFVWIR